MIRDCQHPIARHQHGTLNAYVSDKCRCDPCRKAVAAAERTRRRAKLYGRYDNLVDAEPVREYVRELSAHGVGLRQITRRVGISGGILTKLMYGQPRPDGTRRPPSRRVSKSVAERIRSVPLDALAPGALTDGTGTRRRLQALVTIGWSQCKLADHLGVPRASFGVTMQSSRVTVATATAVKALYDELWNQAPAHAGHHDLIAYNRALRHAQLNGWLPPLAWDDDEIDRPEQPTPLVLGEQLDEIAIEETIRGRRVQLTKEERAEVVRRMTARKFSAKEIGDRIGQSPRNIVRRRAA